MTRFPKMWKTAPMDPDETHTESTEIAQDARKLIRTRTGPRPLSRVRSWLRRDPEPSIVQVMAEWAEYQLIFNDILGRLSAQLARQAKMEKKRLARLQEDAPEVMTPPAQPVTTKQALRTQYALGRYGGRVQALLEAKEARDVGNRENGEG